MQKISSIEALFEKKVEKVDLISNLSCIFEIDQHYFVFQNKNLQLILYDQN